MRYAPLLFLLLANCGPKPASVEDFNSTEVTLPGGQVIKAETMISSTDMLRGMMFRTSIAPDRGMLFLYRTPGHYAFWTYQTPVRLDTIWMDEKRTIVEIVENSPPCETAASKCPHFGGQEMAQYVLQLGAGTVQRYRLKVGQVVRW